MSAATRAKIAADARRPGPGFGANVKLEVAERTRRRGRMSPAAKETQRYDEGVGPRAGELENKVIESNNSKDRVVRRGLFISAN